MDWNGQRSGIPARMRMLLNPEKPSSAVHKLRNAKHRLRFNAPVRNNLARNGGQARRVPDAYKSHTTRAANTSGKRTETHMVDPRVKLLAVKRHTSHDVWRANR